MSKLVGASYQQFESEIWLGHASRTNIGQTKQRSEKTKINNTEFFKKCTNFISVEKGKEQQNINHNSRHQTFSFVGAVVVVVVDAQPVPTVHCLLLIKGKRAKHNENTNEREEKE